MESTFRRNLTTSSASVKQSTKHSPSHTTPHPQHHRCEHLKCRFITLVRWWHGVRERCVTAYSHSDIASRQDGKRHWNEPPPSQAHEVWEPDFLPEWLQLLEFPSAVRAIRAHHVARSQQYSHHSAGSDKLFHCHKLEPEFCLIHKTKLAKRTVRGPTFQPVRGGLPENLYRDKDEKNGKEKREEEGEMTRKMRTNIGRRTTRRRSEG